MKTKTFFMYALILTIGLSFVNCNGNKLGILNTIKYGGDYKKAVKEGDFETAHDIIEKIHDEYVETLGKALSEENKEIDNSLKIISKKYFAAIDYVYSNEITAILTNEDDQAANKIVFLLSEIPIDGECKDGEIWIMSDAIEVIGIDERRFKNIGAYNDVCIEINKLCDKALTLAINRKNKEFAQNLIELYKHDIDTDIDDHVKFVYKTRDAARQKLEDAIKEGKFD